MKIKESNPSRTKSTKITKSQSKKMSETKRELYDEIPKRDTEKIEESREKRYRKAHREAEDRYLYSNTILNLIIRN